MNATQRELVEIKVVLSRVEENLKEHMQRTHNLEGRTDSLDRYMYMSMGVVGVLFFIIALAGTYAAFK